MPVINVRTEHKRDRSTWTLNMLADNKGFAFEGDLDAQYLPVLDMLHDEYRQQIASTAEVEFESGLRAT